MSEFLIQGGHRIPCILEGGKFFKDKRTLRRMVRVDISTAIVPGSARELYAPEVASASNVMPAADLSESQFSTRWIGQFVMLFGERTSKSPDIEQKDAILYRVKLVREPAQILLKFSFDSPSSDSGHWIVDNFGETAWIEIEAMQFKMKAAGRGA